MVQQRKSSIRASLRGTLLLIIIFAWIFGFGASNLHPASAEPAATCPEGASCTIYLPYLFKSSAGDLAITGVEITQICPGFKKQRAPGSRAQHDTANIYKNDRDLSASVRYRYQRYS